jgi:hypothetical protein
LGIDSRTAATQLMINRLCRNIIRGINNQREKGKTLNGTIKQTFECKPKLRPEQCLTYGNNHRDVHYASGEKPMSFVVERPTLEIERDFSPPVFCSCQPHDGGETQMHLRKFSPSFGQSMSVVFQSRSPWEQFRVHRFASPRPSAPRPKSRRHDRRSHSTPDSLSRSPAFSSPSLFRHNYPSQRGCSCSKDCKLR